jgi:coenzyme F420-reducing hydrogenase alpha subunit
MEPQGRVVERKGRKGSAQREAMKDRLERKIQLAQEKLEEIKSTLRKYQQEKSEIVKNSDIRRSSIYSRPPTAPKPST